jgi:hypothetical protein
MKKSIRAATIGCLLFCISSFLDAQMYASNPLRKEHWNAKLLTIRVGMELGDYIGGYIGDSAVLASSWLAPEGQPNTYKASAGEQDYEIQAENDCLHDSWTEMYGPRKCFDGDTSTAWCEGVSGSGEGQVVIAKVDVTKPVRIWAGFGRSKALWENNNRPKDVRVWIIEAATRSGNQNDFYYSGLRVLASKDITLKDLNGFQHLDLGNGTIDLESIDGNLSFVGIQILSVYKGKKYADTLISEIGNVESRDISGIADALDPPVLVDAHPAQSRTIGMNGTAITISSASTLQEIETLLGKHSGQEGKAGGTYYYWETAGKRDLQIGYKGNKISMLILDSPKYN